MAKSIIEPHFDSKCPTTYCIIPKTRNNTHMDRDKLIETLATLIDPCHTVNLKTPDVVIIVQIFKTVCGVSVVHHYGERKQYNIESIGVSQDTNENGAVGM